MKAIEIIKDILSKAIALDQAVQNAMNELTTDTYDENGEWNGFDITDPADEPAYIAIANLHAYLEDSIPELEDTLPKDEILPVPAELRMDDCLDEIRTWAFAQIGDTSATTPDTPKATEREWATPTTSSEKSSHATEWRQRSDHTTQVFKTFRPDAEPPGFFFIISQHERKKET